jgi:hypothetical protein
LICETIMLFSPLRYAHTIFCCAYIPKVTMKYCTMWLTLHADKLAMNVELCNVWVLKQIQICEHRHFKPKVADKAMLYGGNKALIPQLQSRTIVGFSHVWNVGTTDLATVMDLQPVFMSTFPLTLEGQRQYSPITGLTTQPQGRMRLFIGFWSSQPCSPLATPRVTTLAAPKLEPRYLLHQSISLC